VDIPADGIDVPRLDSDSTAVYECALRQDELDTERICAVLRLPSDRVAVAVESLKALRLLRPKPGDPGALVAVSPDAAAGELLAPAELAQRRRQQVIDEIRGDLSALTSVYRSAQRERGRAEAVRVVPEVGEALSLLRNATARCRSEVMSVQPARSRTGTLLSDVLPRDVAMLERGVVLRSLLQHAARYDPEHQTYAEQVAAHKAEIRTLGELPERMIIFDRDIAFLPIPGNRGGAAVVQEPTAVQDLCGVFEHLWDSAIPFRGEPVSASISDLVKQRILRLLADGAKDEVIARRLALSVRTVRKHISEMSQSLGAESRFQAGGLATRAGLTEPGPAPE
jgi:DNA-binding CsgD family transcriptional regulator/sugar-specific transcriptional regulator TrmB